MNKSGSFSRRARIKARRSAVQALYQWHITAGPLADILAEFQNERKQLDKADKDYFRELVEGVGKYRDKIEELMSSNLDRPVNELDPVERSILWLSIYELKYQPGVPVRVIINESIELAKMFGAEDSHKYINGVMDKVAHQIRSSETDNAVNN